MRAYVPIILVALSARPVCQMVSWWLWLRFIRHVLETGGVDAVRQVSPRVARPFWPRTPTLPTDPTTARRRHSPSVRKSDA